MKQANSKSSNLNFVVMPPHNFSYVEENICRCSAPLSRNNISFIQSILIGCIVNVSGRKLDPVLAAYCDEQEISVVRNVVPSDIVLSNFYFDSIIFSLYTSAI